MHAFAPAIVLPVPLGYQPRPFLMGPEHELPAAPAYYRGTRAQWQAASYALDLAYAIEREAERLDVAVHEGTPRAVHYFKFGQRWQDASTVCGCWRCTGTGPTARVLVAARAALEIAENDARNPPTLGSPATL